MSLNFIKHHHRIHNSGLIWAMAVLLGFPAVTYSQDQAVPVATDQVRTESINETIAVFGELVSLQSGPVHVSISAPVSTINVSVGDRVEGGDLLATLDSSILELQRSAVEARIDMSTWATSRRATELELSKQQEDRFRQLRQSAATTEAQLEDAVLKLQISEQALGEAKAATRQIQRELDIANYNISLTNITAPYGGVVIERNIEIGQYVRVGERVVRIVGDHSLEIEAYIPYRYIDALKVGDILTAEFDNGTNFQASLRAFIPEEHVSTRTRAVRFSFNQDEIDDVLAVNQNVIIQVPISDQDEALTVHKDAVVTQQGGHIVFVVEEDAAMPRPITIGDATGSRYEVTSGLSEGEMVVTRGNERLAPGQKVTVIN
jgi:RND family efflux transporter MFP subunit